MGPTIPLLAVFLSCAPKAPPQDPVETPASGVLSENSGKIGVRFSMQPEGMLVLGVVVPKTINASLILVQTEHIR